MKKKWMKILLIINMFLCLFGVQEFRSKSLEMASAMNSKIYAELPSSWSNVELHSWGNGDVKATGTKISNINSKFTLYEFNINTNNNSLLFHSNNFAKKTYNYGDVGNNNYFMVSSDPDSDGIYTWRGAYSSIAVDSNSNEYYFDLREAGSSWNNPHIYMWKDNNINNGWPGVKLDISSNILAVEKIVEGLYKVNLTKGPYTQILLNNGSNALQTNDFSFTNMNGKNCFKLKDNKISASSIYKIATYCNSDSPTYYYVSTVDELTNKVNPSKLYHSFSGWYTAKEGGTKITALSTSSFPNYSGTVYAHFTRNKKQLTVIDDGKTENYTVDEGTTIQQNISPKGKEGYTFSHWSTSLNGPQISGSTIIKSNMTLYAVYKINKYTVTYQYMTGITGPSLGTETVEHGSTIAKTDPTLDGYKFIGWFTDANCTTEFDKATAITDNITLYAKFIAAYTVSYYDGSTLLFTEPCVSGDKISHTEGPEKTGYTFNCWCTDSELNNAYDNNTAITSNLTLYAKYDINIYTITLNNDGATSTISKDYNSTIGELEAPTKTGYDFQHWAWDSLTGPEVKSTDVITSDRTAYAVYTIHTYKITLNNNGNTSIIDRNYNTAIGELEAPTKTGYDFQYWAWDSLTGPEVKSTDVITSDRTAYAVYTIHEYTVTFKLDDEKVHATIYVEYGSAIGTQLPNDPEKTGYTFTGWKLSNGTAITSDSVITSDCIVYANFNINSYTVTFHYGENVNTTSSKTLNYNTELKASEFGVDTSWADHRFTGWYYDSSYTRRFTDGDRVSGNIDLYAKYSESSYRYVYVDGSKLTDCFIDSNTYVHMYSDSAETTWPGTKDNVTYIGNKIVRIKVDVSIYTNIIVNNGVKSSSATLHGKESKSITLDDNEIYYTLKDEYVTENYAYKYSFTSETVPANLLKAQVANISGDLDMYRFTMGAANNALYGFKFVFINGSSSDIRYWNFSKESMLTQVRFGAGDANLYKPGTYNGVKYDGYYSLTIKETSSFKLTNYDRVLVLACCKDNTGVNVVKAVEYSIDKTTGALTRVA